MPNTHKTNLSTEELLKILHSAKSVSDLSSYTETLSAHETFLSFSEYMQAFLIEHNIMESRLIQDSLIQRNYAYQILNGSKNPGRDKVFALCIAAQMSFEETQRALTLANFGKLYPRRTRDAIIIFALEHDLSVQQTNELLYEEGENPLE